MKTELYQIIGECQIECFFIRQDKNKIYMCTVSADFDFVKATYRQADNVATFKP